MNAAAATTALRLVLLDRVRTDRDAEVTRMAAQVLLERFNATDEVRDLLIERIRDDADPLLRRASVRVLGERLGADPVVQSAAGRTDPRSTGMPWCLRAATQSLVERFGPDVELRGLLVDRAQDDADEMVRRAALRMLIECFGRDVPMSELLIGMARTDRDADVRLIAVRGAGRTGRDGPERRWSRWASWPRRMPTPGSG